MKTAIALIALLFALSAGTVVATISKPVSSVKNTAQTSLYGVYVNAQGALRPAPVIAKRGRTWMRFDSAALSFDVPLL